MSDWLSLLLDCMTQSWSRPTGDPGAIGWTITIGYAVAAAASFGVAGRGISHVRERVFWVGLGLFLAFMAVNKQLDLQVWTTATGRCVARAEGWYRQRREVQAEFVRLLALGLGAIMLALIVYLRKSLRRNWVAILGLIVLAGFIIQRAVSFHHLDRALHVEILTLRAHRWVELGGLALILLGVVMRERRRR